MKIDAEFLDKILHGPIPKAQQTLERLLSSAEFDKDFYGNLVAQLFSMERYPLAALIFKRWTEIDSANPEPWSNFGLTLSRSGELLSALQALHKALEIDSEYSAAMNNLVGVYQFLGDYVNQLKTAQIALQLQPFSAVAFNNLGTALLEHGNLSEARVAFEKSAALDPNYFEANFNLARVDAGEGRHREAIRFLENALTSRFAKINRYRDMIEYDLSFEYLTTGRLDEGWVLYETGFSRAISPRIARMPNRLFSVPSWNGSSLGQNDRLMIWREQGVGDEIRFATLIPLLPQSVRNNLVLECDHRLVDLFSRSMPGVRVRAESQTSSDFDYHLPIGSLPRLFMKSVDVLRDAPPLLDPDPEIVAKFAARLAEFKDRKLVGICWRSHKLSATRNNKYTALEDWRDILSIPGAVFVNLQYGECEEEIQQIEREIGIRILRWKDLDLMNDFSGVAALIKNLDLVVSISSAVVPLAGAVGTQTIAMTRQNWVLLGETNSYPWFPSVTPVIVPHGQVMAAALPVVAQRLNSL